MQAIATEATVVWYLVILLLQQWNDKCLFPSHWNYESKERMINNLCQCKKNTIQSILHWNFIELRCLIGGKGMYNLGYLQRRNRMELKFLSCKSSGSGRCLRVNYLQSLGILLFLLQGANWCEKSLNSCGLCNKHLLLYLIVVFVVVLLVTRSPSVLPRRKILSLISSII